jgi:hypothetical protein
MVGPEDPTCRAPLHLQPTVLAAPPAAAPTPPADSSPLSSQLPAKRHLVAALLGAAAIAALLFVGLVITLVIVARDRASTATAPHLAVKADDDANTSGSPRAPAPATTCASGVSCEPTCADLLDGEAEFELRFTYVQLEGGAIQTRYPDAEVCTSIANGGQEVCTSVLETQRTRFARDYLTATHEELAKRGLDITVRDRPGGRTLASASAARPRYGVIKRSALCRGYVVPGPFHGAEPVLHATYFTHPKGSPAAR